MKPVRIDRVATVKATGRRFLVTRLSFPRDKSEPAKVYCHGEIHSAKETMNGGARYTYSGTRVFLKDAVDIEEKKLTFEFITELWRESSKIRAAKLGQVVEFRTTRKGNTRGRGRPATADELMSRAAQAEEDGDLELATALMTAAEKAEQHEQYLKENPGAARAQYEIPTNLTELLNRLSRRPTKHEEEKFAAEEWEAERRANL